jgi:CheY-like chemotaxis protein
MALSKIFLIVDDSYIDRLVSAMLIKRTFNIETVVEVSGGNPALEWLKKKPLDQEVLILLDIMMPQMNGFQFLDQFEKLDKSARQNVMVVMLSSTLADEDVLRAKQHPMVKKLLSKPLSPNELKPFV